MQKPKRDNNSRKATSSHTAASARTQRSVVERQQQPLAGIPPSDEGWDGADRHNGREVPTGPQERAR